MLVCRCKGRHQERLLLFGDVTEIGSPLGSMASQSQAVGYIYSTSPEFSSNGQVLSPIVYLVVTAKH